MSSKNQVLKYGVAAVLVSIAIIVAVTVTNPLLFPSSNTSSSSTKIAAPSYTFVVMLTDPPTVPAGTTWLNLTYTQVSLHVVYPNGTSIWVPINVSGTVDLFSLVNMSKTVASTTLPLNTTVDRIQFTISTVQAKVNQVVYNVTALSNELIASITNSQKLNQTQGVLFDFLPTLVQIQATNSTGGSVSYFVLVPSSTATIVSSISSDHMKVGTIVKIGEKDNVKLISVKQEVAKKIEVTSSSLTVKGNVTNFSVTLANEGNMDATISGLTLNGVFNDSFTSPVPLMNNAFERGIGREINNLWTEAEHNETIPFRVNGTNLVPFFGIDDVPRVAGPVSSLTIQPGKSVTLSFSGVIQLGLVAEPVAMIRMPVFSIVVTPIPGNAYTIRLTGEGSQTFSVTATAA